MGQPTRRNIKQQMLSKRGLLQSLMTVCQGQYASYCRGKVVKCHVMWCDSSKQIDIHELIIHDICEMFVYVCVYHGSNLWVHITSQRYLYALSCPFKGSVPVTSCLTTFVLFDKSECRFLNNLPFLHCGPSYILFTHMSCSDLHSNIYTTITSHGTMALARKSSLSEELLLWYSNVFDKNLKNIKAFYTSAIQ